MLNVSKSLVVDLFTGESIALIVEKARREEIN